jgi:uncharacterized membrane protein YccC
LSTIFWADVRKAGLVLGSGAAVWLHISLPEGALMTAAFFCYLGQGAQAMPIRVSGYRGRRASLMYASVVPFFGTQWDGCAAIWCAYSFTAAKAGAILLKRRSS